MKTDDIKSALIIGGSDGIGKACSKKLRDKGYRIINISRNESCEADENLYCDISDGNLGQIVRSAFEEAPDISPILYCAGCSLAAPVEYAVESDVRHLFEVNFFGFCECVKTALIFMKASGGGYIGAVSSLGSKVPIAFDAYYSASKAALDMFVREVAIETAPFNIKLASFRPGGVATDFTFKRKIYDYDGTKEYAAALNSSVHKLASIEQNGDSPETVADFILEKTEKNRGGIFNIGVMNAAVATISSLVPSSLFDAITKKYFTDK